MEASSKLVIVRGAGDLASGIIHALVRAGRPVIALETKMPASIRREVCFSEAVYDGEMTVEGVTARFASDPEESLRIVLSGCAAILIDPDCSILKSIQPAVLIDATMAKRNLGTRRDMAPLTIALGPGFTAGTDVDYVVETMRGPSLGRIISEGTALPDTGVPGMVGGYAAKRVIHAPENGVIRAQRKIGDSVREGDIIAQIEVGQRTVPVPASLTGVLRGMIRDGYPVKKGLKIADIDPRPDSRRLCYQISDKSRRVAQSVLEIIEKGV
jgi:xanthine dehydrogenase accessory factor